MIKPYGVYYRGQLASRHLIHNRALAEVGRCVLEKGWEPSQVEIKKEIEGGK